MSKLLCKLGLHNYDECKIERLARNVVAKGKLREYYIFAVLFVCKCGVATVDTKSWAEASTTLERQMQYFEYHDEVFRK